MSQILSTRPLYRGWLGLTMATVRADSGDIFDRHVVEMGRAVVVLPYDPARRCLLLVSMPRAPVTLLGLADFLEPVAGSLDEDDAADCARREAMEEAGVRLAMLEHVGEYWSMPSFSTESIDYYLAPYSLADRVGSGGGSPDEQENITVHELPAADIWARFERGEIKDGKLAIALMALRLRKPDMFAPDLPASR